MMSNISLTYSMKSNLLSLQAIANRQTIVQNQLSTGLKVSSALDNPSSYYTARELNYRAGELSGLLDEMSLSVKTLKSTTDAIESGIRMLELARTMAEQASEVKIPEGYDPEEPDTSIEINSKAILSQMMKEYSISGVVVSTKAELTAAVAAAKTGGDKNIVIWGNIDMGNTALVFGDDVRLVSGETLITENNLANDYRLNNSGKAKINFDNNGGFVGGNAAITAGQNNTISDIEFSYTAYSKQALVYNDKKRNLIINNVKVNLHSVNSTGMVLGVFESTGSSDSQIIMTGKNEVGLTGQGLSWNAVRGGWSSYFEVKEGASLTTHDLRTCNGGNNIIRGTLNAYRAYTLSLNPSNYEVFGTINFYTNEVPRSNIFGTSNEVKFRAGSVFNVIDEYGSLPDLVDMGKKFTFDAGVTINFTDTTKDKNSMTVWKSKQAGTIIGPFSLKGANTPDNYPQFFDKTIVTLKPDEGGGDTGNDDLDKPGGGADAEAARKKLKEYRNRYDEIISQYNALINDASYNGVNLLKLDDLKVKFNADGSSFLDIVGKDASSRALGIRTGNWSSEDGIRDVIENLDQAIGKLRLMSQDFGNAYSIVTTRENFSEKLINILTEGADKLTLADMNEVSAAQLSLQTRQGLAINALSLASQSAQAVLKLF